ncbi:phosphate acetyltransferase [Hamadaea tsunoensis]|uniref:phosphate acetyltransferase n=1 Tax=Hamadaea tsunoensis TaxID=53368 RepID=UPI0004879CEF|nr:phosphate acetyltransferase [Hamadaea tsunoensis]
MARSVYVTGLDAGGGKSTIALGVAELLSRRVRRIGVFRPFTRKVDDPIVTLVRNHYAISPMAAGTGVTYAEAALMLGRGQQDAVVGLILERFHEIERNCDAVVVVGTDFGAPDGGEGEATFPDELGMNIRLAGELGAPLLPVVDGDGRTTQEIDAALRAAQQAVLGHPLIALFANRVSAEQMSSLPAVIDGTPVYAVPRIAAVSAPTVAEVVQVLGATPLLGTSPQALDRDVLHIVVGGATVPTFLDHVSDGCLVITPGDRADLIVASMAAHSSGLASIAGLILTLGIEPDPRVVALIGRFRAELPVISVRDDSFETVSRLTGLEGALKADNPRKVNAALGAFEASVDVPELTSRLDVTRSERVTPLMFEYELIERARADLRQVVLPEGTEERVLRAAEQLLRRGVCELTLLGPVDVIEERVRDLGLDLGLGDGGARLVDPVTSPWRTEFAGTYAKLREHKGMTLEKAYDQVSDVNYFGTLMVNSGRADAMVSGCVHPTADTIRPAFEIIKTASGVSIASSVFFMCLADRVLVYGDCAINPDPNPEQLADIAISSAETAARFGVEPRVAMLSYSTGGSGFGADVDKVAAATKLVRERRPDLPVEGPIQYDAAVDPSVAATKLPGSEVAGHATVLIFPDLNTGNNTYKAVQRSAGAVAVGPVMQGLRKPVNDLSRGATVRDIISTVAITAIQAAS